MGRYHFFRGREMLGRLSITLVIITVVPMTVLAVTPAESLQAGAKSGNPPLLLVADTTAPNLCAARSTLSGATLYVQKEAADLLANAAIDSQENFMLRGLQSSGCCG